mmetsp:Transcript_47968/g.120720  ORF Transcript_47968/g.120720 Transcript_47968/m.120720 type:complete len:257 (+) Transcript_47968:2-772(+)
MSLLPSVKEEVDQGMSVRSACEKVSGIYQLPSETIRRAFNRHRKDIGPGLKVHKASILTMLEEVALERLILHRRAIGTDLNARDATRVIISFKNVDEDWVGLSWYARFLKRHPQLCRNPQEPPPVKTLRTSTSELSDEEVHALAEKLRELSSALKSCDHASLLGCKNCAAVWSITSPAWSLCDVCSYDVCASQECRDAFTAHQQKHQEFAASRRLLQRNELARARLLDIHQQFPTVPNSSFHEPRLDQQQGSTSIP